jgi:hypothetical protein
MNVRIKRLLLVLPFTFLPAALLVEGGAGCEVALNLNPMLVDAGARTDVLDCGICADVSADAEYDADYDVNIYGVPVEDDATLGARDGAPGADATLRDAAADGLSRDGALR